MFKKYFLQQLYVTRTATAAAFCLLVLSDKACFLCYVFMSSFLLFNATFMFLFISAKRQNVAQYEINYIPGIVDI